MRRRQVYVSVAAGKTETAVHIIHNIHICGCVKMHLSPFTHPLATCGIMPRSSFQAVVAGARERKTPCAP